MRFLSVSLILSCIAITVTPVDAQVPTGKGADSTLKLLTVFKTIPLGGEGEWGFPTIDGEARRLYLPRTKVIQVFDLDKGTLVGTIPGVSEQVCHGVAMAPDQKLGFASAGKDNNVAAFDPATLKVTTRVDSSVNPNAMIYDPANKRIVVMNHAAVTIINPADLKAKPVVIETGNGLEFAAADGKGSAFVCVEHDDMVLRIDTNAGRIVDRSSVAPGKVPVGIAIDSKSHRLFVTCRGKIGATADDKTGLLAVIDAASGKVLSSPSIGTGASGVVFDPTTGMALTANGKDGTVSVVKETKPGAYEAVRSVKTMVGARHIALDAKTHQGYLPCMVPSDSGVTFGLVVVGVKTVEFIRYEDAPKTVRDSIEGRFPGATVTTAEKENEDGKINYEIELKHNDRVYELHILENGNILEIEKEIKLKDIPEVVLKAVKDKYPDAPIQGVMEVFKVKDKKETPDHYLVAVTIGDKKKEFTLSLDGKTIK
jgi:DNA-binding beta-propeller fold protein YncE